MKGLDRILPSLPPSPLVIICCLHILGNRYLIYTPDIAKTGAAVQSATTVQLYNLWKYTCDGS